MIHKATKHCDVCGRTVARKGVLFFRTETPYVTVRKDTFSNNVNHHYNLHVCSRCLEYMREAVAERIREEVE